MNPNLNNIIKALTTDTIPSPTTVPNVENFKDSLNRFNMLLRTQSATDIEAHLFKLFNRMTITANQLSEILSYILSINLEQCFRSESGDILRSCRVSKSNAIPRTIDILIDSGSIFIVIMINNKQPDHQKLQKKIFEEGSMKVYKPELLIDLSNFEVQSNTANLNYILPHIKALARKRVKISPDFDIDFTGKYGKLIKAIRDREVSTKINKEIGIARQFNSRHVSEIKPSGIFANKQNDKTIYLYAANGLGSLYTFGAHYKINKHCNFYKKDIKKTVLSLIRDMINSVNQLHSKEIIHRDIKSENFIVMQDSSNNIFLMIDDFGSAIDLEYCKKLTADLLIKLGYASHVKIEKDLILRIEDIELLIRLCINNYTSRSKQDESIITLDDLNKRIYLALKYNGIDDSIIEAYGNVDLEAPMATWFNASPQIFHCYLSKIIDNKSLFKYYNEDLNNVVAKSGKQQYMEQRNDITLWDSTYKQYYENVTTPCKEDDIYALGVAIEELFVRCGCKVQGTAVEKFINELCHINPKQRLTSERALMFWQNIMIKTCPPTNSTTSLPSNPTMLHALSSMTVRSGGEEDLTKYQKLEEEEEEEKPPVRKSSSNFMKNG